MSGHCPGCDGFLASWDKCRGLSEPDLAVLLEAKLMEYVRSGAGGLPVRPETVKVISSFLVTLDERGGGGKPRLLWREPGNGYVLEWYCEPPRPRHRFRVNHEEWATEHGMPVRRVYEIGEIYGATSEDQPGTDSDGPAGPASGAGPVPEAPATAP